MPFPFYCKKIYIFVNNRRGRGKKEFKTGSKNRQKQHISKNTDTNAHKRLAKLQFVDVCVYKGRLFSDA